MPDIFDEITVIAKPHKKDIFDKIDIFDDVSIVHPITRTDVQGKRIVATLPVPQGEKSQQSKEGRVAEVIEFPEQEVTATKLAPRTKEEEKEMKRVKEYVDTQRFYARQREIPRIGTGSPEERAGVQMEAIAEGIQRNPFVNPLAGTISGLETGIAGAKQLRRPGVLPKVLGAAEIALGTGQILTPEFTAPISMAGEIVPEITQGVTAPITTLVKPESEAGKIGTMIGDIAYQGLLLSLTKGFKPKGKSGVKLTAEEAELGLARAEAGDVRVRNMQEANIAEQIKGDVELRTRAKADLQKRLDKKLTDEEFDMMLEDKIAQKREYQESAKELNIKPPKQEELPSLLYGPEGERVPITSVRETRETAQAPLRGVEKETFPFSSEFAFGGRKPLPPEVIAEGLAKPIVEPSVTKTEATILPPSQRQKMIKELKTIGEEAKDFNDESLIAKYRELGLDKPAPISEAPVSRGGDISVRGEANKEQIRRFEEIQKIKKINWVRGVTKMNEGRPDKFFSASRETASNYAIEKVGDVPKYERIKETEKPKNPLVVNDKTELAEKIGYKGDPLAEQLKAKIKFDDAAKEYARKNGYDAIVYEEGTFGEPELHLFGKEPVKASLKPAVDLNRKLSSVAGAVYGIEQDDEGNVKINPLKFALGALAGGIVLNPNIRAKLAKAIGKDAAKMTDEQIVGEYKKKFGEAINVRKPNDKLYVENVRLDKFSDPVGVAEAVTGLSKKEILSARRKLNDAQIAELAQQEQPLIDEIRAGKIEKGRAYNAPQIQRISAEVEKIVKEKGNDINKLSKEEQNIVQVMLGMTYESGLAQREFSKGVPTEVADFFKKLDPDAPLKEKMPPSALEMLAEFAGAVKLASGSGIIRSLVGNTFSRALYKPEILISSQINGVLAPILKRQRDRFAEEALYNRIVGRGTAKEGLKTAREIFMGDESALAKNAFLQSEGYSFEGAIPGKFGKVVRTPFRAQGSVDAIFRLPLRDIEIARMAIRKATQEGKGRTIEETLNIAQKYFDDAPEEWISRADENAKYWTYQNKGGSTLRGFSAFRQFPIVRLFVPFFTTQANMAKFILERTPFAPMTPQFVQSVWEAVTKNELQNLTDAQKRLGTFTGRDFTPGQVGFLSDKLARMATGTSILGGTYMLVDHVVDGNITADYPSDKKERAAWDLQGKTPYSIKIPGTNWWVSYSGFEPVSSFMTAAAQYYQAKNENRLSPEEEKSWHKDITKYFTGLMKSYSEAPSFVGIKYLTDGFFEEGELSGKAESAVSNFVVGLVTPTIVRQTTNVIDPRRRQPEGVAERISSTIPLASKYIPSRKDVLGEDLKLTSPATRLAGVLVSKESEEKINQEIARLRVAPLPPAEIYAGFKLKRDEVLELQNLAGKNLKPALKPLIESDGWSKIPDQIKIDIIEKIKRNIYGIQREVLFPRMEIKGKIKDLPEIKGAIGEEEKREWMDLIGGNE